MLYFDPNDPKLRAKVAALQPTPGYCVFADICGSTAMKDHELHRWAAKTHNAFANVLTFMPVGAFPLKCLGDALMYFIPGAHLHATRQAPLQLFGGLASLVDDEDPWFPELKVAVVAGAAYELTFVRRRPDVYGKDIDLTARLLGKAKRRQVVMNRQFFDEVTADYSRIGSGAGFDEAGRIRPLGTFRLKGFKGRVETYVYGR